MLGTRPEITPQQFEAATGWSIKPEGACKGEECIPLREQPGETLDIARIAEQMNMPLVRTEAADAWALGPASPNGRTLTTAEAPDLELPDLDGKPFRLRSLRGRKVVVYAWAPY